MLFAIDFMSKTMFYHDLKCPTFWDEVIGFIAKPIKEI